MKNIKKILLKFFPLLVTFGLFAILFDQLPSDSSFDISSALQKISPITILLLGCSFVLTLFIASFRLKLAYKQFYVRLPFRASFEAVVSGAISSLFLLPFVGTILGQGLILRKVDAPAEITTLVCLYERVVMAISGLIVSLISVLLFFPDFQNIEGIDGIRLVEISFFILASFSFVVLIASRENRSALKLAFSSHHIGYFLASFATSIIGWLVMSIGYVLLVQDFTSTTSPLPLFGCALIISFLSSLPISVSGWGVREYASITLFGMFAISLSVALTTAITIGLLSFVWLMLTAGFFYLWNKMPRISKKAIIGPETPLKGNLISVLTYGVVASICFQLHLKLDVFTLNLNFADIFALSALGLTLLDMIEKRFSFKEMGRPTYLFSITATAAIGLSLAIGFMNFGFSSWAFYNKFLGWFVMWGYAILAFRFYKEAGLEGIKKIFKFLAIILTVTSIYKIMQFPLRDLGYVDKTLLDIHLLGFLANRTAFQLVMAFVATFFIILNKKSQKNLGLTAFLFAAGICSLSRTAFVLVPLIYSFLFVSKVIDFKSLIRLSLYTIICVTAILFTMFFGAWFWQVVSYIFLSIFGLQSGAGFVEMNTAFFTRTIQHNITSPSSNVEHVNTMIEAFNMWLRSPIFGEGLGAFVQNELTSGREMLVIHNTVLWLLAEFGIIGTLPFIAYFMYLFYLPLKQGVTEMNVEGQLMLSFLFIFGLASMPHEIMYQRIVWLILGVVAALSIEMARKDVKKEARAAPTLATT